MTSRRTPGRETQLPPAARIVALACLAICRAATAAPPATQPQSAAEAVYRAHVQLAETLLDEPSAEDLSQLARAWRARGDHARAAVYGLTALRGKPNDPDIEYEVACNFALWDQKPLAVRYLSRSADHGYWGYRVLADDTDVNAIKNDPAFPAILAKVKAAFDVQAPKHPPGQTTKVPKGAAPADGWPVMVSLHGWGSSRHDFDSAAEFVATLGYVGVTLDGNEVMGPGAYTWTNESADRTHARVQAAVAGLGVKVNPRRVYLHGFSQGAMHAARLLAEHPDTYAGAIANSPGPSSMTPAKLADPTKTGVLVLSIGDREHPDTAKSVGGLEKLWRDGGRPVQAIHFRGGHQLPPDADGMFRDSLARLATGK